MVIHSQDQVLDIINEDSDLRSKSVDITEMKELQYSGGNFLRIIHFNIRSINKNMDGLLTFLESYKLRYIDIIVLTETFQLASTTNCNIPGYQFFYNEATFNKNDGVIILVKDNIDVDFSFEVLNISRATLGRITFRMNDVSFGLTAVYKPPPIPNIDFVHDIHSFLDNEARESIEIFIGDININLLNNNDNDVIEYLALMNSIGYQSYINSVTRSLSKTCLDHIFVKKRLSLDSLQLSSFVINEDITDHSPVVLFVGQEKSDKKTFNNEQKHQIKSKININKLIDQLRQCDWSNVTDKTDPQIATKMFLSTYMELISKSTETYTVNNGKYKKIKNWISAGIVTSIKIRDKMKKKLLSNYSTHLDEEYKKYRNYLNKLIHKQKNNYYKKKLKKIKRI